MSYAEEQRRFESMGERADAEIAVVRAALAAKADELAAAKADDLSDEAQITKLAGDLAAAQARIVELQALQPTDDRPSGPGFVRYESLYRSGDTVSDVLARVSDGRVVTFPEGRFEVADFAAGYLAGISVAPGCGGIIGSGQGTLGGSKGTVFTMKERSSTKAALVPKQDDVTPMQLVLLKSLDPTTPKTFQNFQVAGTEQGHIYSLVQHYNNGSGGQRALMDTLFQDLLLVGWDGNAGAPPGETSALSVSGPGYHVQRRVEIDGRRALGGPVFGAMGLTHQNAYGALAEDVYSHHCRVANFVGFQSVNGIVRRLRSDAATGVTNGLGNGSLNFERTAGYLLEGCEIIGRQRKVHITHSNDHWSLNLNGKSYPIDGGSLTVVDPKWNGLWRPDELADYLYVQSWGPYWNGSTMSFSKTAPVVRKADGSHIPYKYVAADGRGVVT